MHTLGYWYLKHLRKIIRTSTEAFTISVKNAPQETAATTIAATETEISQACTHKYHSVALAPWP